MTDPVIPNIPASMPSDQTAFFKALKGSIEYLMGQGRTPDEDRALRVGELESLGIDLTKFLNSSISDPYSLNSPHSITGAMPDPPTDLVVIKGAFVHTLTWTNPSDLISWYIEVWVADDSQSRDDAKMVGVCTIVDSTRGEAGVFKYSGFDLTHDQTYWLRTRSYGYRYSEWCPPDSQGGYVVPGDDSVQETVTKVLEVLQGEITEDQLYIDLSSRIDLIDTSGTGIIDRLSYVESNLGGVTDFDEDVLYEAGETVLYNPGSGDYIYSCLQDVLTTPAPLPTDTLYWKKIGESDSLAGNILANATAISDVGVRVTDNEGDISAIAIDVSTVQTTIGGHTTAIQTNLTSINGVEGKYSVKIDNNGYVTGFGLISTDNDGYPTSEFILLVDNFKIVTPGKSPRVPFVIGQVDGADTIGIDGNMVIDGSLLAPSIAADAIKAAHIDTNEIFVGMTIQSSNYISGSQGWKLTEDGNMEIYGGSIVLGAGSSGYSSLTDKPGALSAINPTEASRLASMAYGADVTNYNDTRVANSQISLSGLGAGSLAYLSRITDTYIDNNGISAAKISANDLAALSANMGTLNVNSFITVNGLDAGILTTGKWYANGVPGFILAKNSTGCFVDIGSSERYLRYYNGVLEIGGDIVSTGNIKANNITTNTINNEATSIVTAALTGGPVAPIYNTDTTLTSTYLASSGYQVAITASTVVVAGSVNTSGYLKITCDGTTLIECFVYMVSVDRSYTLHYAHTPGAGGHTYTISFNGLQFGAFYNNFIKVQETKK